MATVDVTVMGAGVFGLSVAYACALRGARVRIIDPGGVAAGASGGVVGALAPHVPEQWNAKKAFQFESLIMAEDYWRDVANRSGQATGYCRSGRLQPLADETAVARAQLRAESAVDLWQGMARWDLVRQPADGWAPVSPSGVFVHDTLSALIHPRKATHALARAIVALGGEVLKEGVPAGRVVWATGWQGLVKMSQDAGVTIGNGVKGQAALLRYNAAGAPQLFCDGVHVVPHLDGTVAIGSTSEREYGAPASTDAQLEQVLSRAVAAVPQLAGAEVVARWAGVRPRSRSRAPMLGPHPFRSGDFVANGGFKIGFGMAPKVGDVMADLILDGQDTIPDAFKPAANVPNGSSVAPR